MDKKFRVFHGLVNYGTQAGFFARELRKQGISSMSVCGYDRLNRIIDVTLKNSGNNILQKAYHYIWNSCFKVKSFFSFDIFHFYYGITLTNKQWDLPFYKLFGKKVVFHYLGFDVQLYQHSVDKFEVTNLRFEFNSITGALHDKAILKRLKFETKYADIQIVCAPCYSEFVNGSIVLPLAIDIDEYAFSIKQNTSDELVILHAPTSRDNKGTSFILEAISRLIKEGYKIKFVLVENLSHKDLKDQYKKCDIFIDQIVAGWYGTASVEAMAIGRPVICSIRKEYFEYINYGNDIPIIHAYPDSIYDVIKETILHPERLGEIGLKSRKFVEKVHDLRRLTGELILNYKKVY